MKKIVSLIFIIILSIQINAQDNVFVLIDVSKSMNNSSLNNESKDVILDLLQGRFNSNGWQLKSINDTKISAILNQQNPISLVGNGSFLCIMYLGDINTCTNNYFSTIISKYPTDLISFWSSYYPLVYGDSYTYIDLTQAFTAKVALENSIKYYYIMMITDGNGTNRTNSGVTLDQINKDLIINFNNSKFSKVDGVGAIEKGKYTIFFKKVDITNMPLANSGVLSPPLEALKIELTSFNGGTSKKPFVIKDSKFTISWFCKNAPKDVQYKIRLSPIKNSGEKTQVLSTTGNSYNVQNIPDGIWRITVSSGTPNFNASSASTTVEVNASGSAWFLWLLFLFLLFGGGYWYWKKMQNDKLQKLNSVSNKDNFSGSSTLNTNSDNSGYF